mmetsp:Transcript_17108/g.40844  ORF Transcript_17108/g.40844 Transcript_17108/m.40844 type:complete len:81 (-) Transcript_17108:208-450(-)
MRSSMTLYACLMAHVVLPHLLRLWKSCLMVKNPQMELGRHTTLHMHGEYQNLSQGNPESLVPWAGKMLAWLTVRMALPKK